MARVAKFQPHAYATALIQSDEWRSDRSTLYHWTGTFWQAMPDVEATSAAYHWLVNEQPEHVSPENATRSVRAALMFLPPLQEMAANSDLVIVPCRNGYVHVPKAGEPALLPADKSLGIQHVLACDYDPLAMHAPLFQAFIDRAVPWASVQERVQEYVGYTLLPDTRYQRAQLWMGDGANGKGVLANVVQHLHGAVAAVRLDDLDGFRLSGLLGASLVYCDEVPKGKIDEQMLKSLIAGERVQVDRKYQQPLSLRLQGKWLVLGNHVPQVADHSVGFWRRWDIVPFGATVAEKDRDPMLAEKIVQLEMHAVLNWALVGLQRLLARNGFDPDLPEPMRDMLESAKTESNSALAWLADVELTLVPGGDSTPSRKTGLYAQYRDWCTANGMQSMSAMKWWQNLERYYGDNLVLKRRREKPTDNPDWFANLVPGALYVPTSLSLVTAPAEAA